MCVTYAAYPLNAFSHVLKGSVIKYVLIPRKKRQFVFAIGPQKYRGMLNG
jgi:hypothetical protein